MSNKNPMPSIAEGGVLHSDPKRHRRTNLIDSICAESFASFKTVDIPTIFHDHIEAPTTAIIPGLDSSILKIADNPLALDREYLGQTIEWVAQKVLLDPRAPAHWMIFNKILYKPLASHMGLQVKYSRLLGHGQNTVIQAEGNTSELDHFLGHQASEFALKHCDLSKLQNEVAELETIYSDTQLEKASKSHHHPSTFISPIAVIQKSHNPFLISTPTAQSRIMAVKHPPS